MKKLIALLGTACILTATLAGCAPQAASSTAAGAAPASSSVAQATPAPTPVPTPTPTPAPTAKPQATYTGSLPAEVEWVIPATYEDMWQPASATDPYIGQNGTTWDFIDHTGKVITQLELDATYLAQHMPYNVVGYDLTNSEVKLSTFCEGLAKMYLLVEGFDDFTIGYVDATGELVLDFSYDSTAGETAEQGEGLRPWSPDDPYTTTWGEVGITSTDFADGLAAVSAATTLWVGDCVTYIDKTGKAVLYPPEDVSLQGYAKFADGLGLQLTEDGVARYIDTTGKVVITLEEGRNAGSFHEGYAYYWSEDGTKVGFMDKTGKVVVEPTFQVVSQMNSDGVFAFCKEEGGLYGLMDLQGNEILKPTYHHVSALTEGLAKASPEEGSYGLINAAGEWVIAPEFVNLSSPENGQVMVIAKTDSGEAYGVIKNPLVP